MGNNKFKLTKLALALGLTATLSGCFSDNDNNDYVKPPEPPVPTQDVAVPPTAAERQAGSITVNLVDVTGAQLADDVTATITFTSAEDGLLSVAGTELANEDKATTNSSFAFTLESIPANGVSYDYVVSADGYLSNSGTFVLTTTENVEAAEIRLTPRSLANSDVAIVADTKTLTELVPAGENTTVSYDPASGLSVSGDKTEITLPQVINKPGIAVGGTTVKIKNGTQFLDKDGVALTSAPSLTVAYFANEATRNTTEAAGVAATNSSLDAFPGGLALSVTSPSDVTSTGSFTSGGFVAIELVDDAGNKVKSFGAGNTLTVAMQVDQKTSNPCPVKFDANAAGDITAQAEATAFAAGVCQLAAPVATRPLEADDIFPIWSYDEDTGKWVFENYGLVVDNGNANTFDVEVEVNHLSYWNLDFFNNNRCNSVSFDILDSGDAANTIATSIVLESSGYRRVFTSYGGDYSKATFNNPPAFPVTVKVLRDGQNVLDGFANSADGTAQALSVANMCDLNNDDLKLTIAPPTIVAKQLTPQLVCSNTDDFDVNADPVVTPSIVTLFRNNRFVQNYYPTGAFSVNLETGATYSARYYDYNSRTWLSTAIEANATAATLDIPVECEVETVPVTGTGTGTTGGS